MGWSSKKPPSFWRDFPAIFWQNPAFGRFGQILIATLQLFGALQPAEGRVLQAGAFGHLFSLELDS